MKMGYYIGIATICAGMLFAMSTWANAAPFTGGNIDACEQYAQRGLVSMNNEQIKAVYLEESNIVVSDEEINSERDRCQVQVLALLEKE